MKFNFREVKLSPASLLRLDQINHIIEEYQKDGYTLTLRQLYYQLVSRDIIPNKPTEYSKLSGLLKEGRMGGIVDWAAIEDRLRAPYSPASFESPADILEAAANQYQLPRMGGQPVNMEVWVEKDALSGVLKRVTSKYHVPIMVNRGYSSASAMYESFNRFLESYLYGKPSLVLYLGDFDPSGVDMIRDIKDRIFEFADGYKAAKGFSREFEFDIVPLALTEEQIGVYAPPPNPAKLTDPRAKKFVEAYGGTSWEVDALRPEVLHQILEDAIKSRLDLNKYNAMLEQEKGDVRRLKNLKNYL